MPNPASVSTPTLSARSFVCDGVLERGWVGGGKDPVRSRFPEGAFSALDLCSAGSATLAVPHMGVTLELSGAYPSVRWRGRLGRLSEPKKHNHLLISNSTQRDPDHRSEQHEIARYSLDVRTIRLTIAPQAYLFLCQYPEVLK